MKRTPLPLIIVWTILSFNVCFGNVAQKTNMPPDDNEKIIKSLHFTPEKETLLRQIVTIGPKNPEAYRKLVREAHDKGVSDDDILEVTVGYYYLVNGDTEYLTSNKITGKDALQILNAGQERYLSGQTFHSSLAEEAREVTSQFGQFPIATIVACSDSRQPIELIFDMGVGDLFTIRVPGNVPTIDIIGSVEFGISYLKTPLCVVLGHTQCGAVKAALNHTQFGNKFDIVLAYITPVVKQVEQTAYATREELVNEAIRQNVRATIHSIKSYSEVVAKSVQNGTVLIKGGVYDIATGRVEWLD